MAVNPVLPNFTEQDATAYKTAIDTTSEAQNASGAFYCHESVTPDMLVLAEGGFLASGEAVESESVAQPANPAAQNRIDLMQLDSIKGVFTVVGGVESASPVAPPPSSGNLPLAQIYRTPIDTAIRNNAISDSRSLFSETSIQVLKRAEGNPQPNLDGVTGSVVMTQSGVIAQNIDKLLENQWGVQSFWVRVLQFGGNTFTINTLSIDTQVRVHGSFELNGTGVVTIGNGGAADIPPFMISALAVQPSVTEVVVDGVNITFEGYGMGSIVPNFTLVNGGTVTMANWWTGGRTAHVATGVLPGVDWANFGAPWRGIAVSEMPGNKYSLSGLIAKTGTPAEGEVVATVGASRAHPTMTISLGSAIYRTTTTNEIVLLVLQSTGEIMMHGATLAEGNLYLDGIEWLV